MKERKTNIYDPFFLNSILFATEVFEEQIPKSFGKYFWDSPFFRILLLYVKLFLKAIVRTPIRCWFFSSRDYCSLLNNKIVFLLTTLNNLKALQDVISDVKSKKDNVLVIDANNSYTYYPMFLLLAYSIKSIPSFFLKYKSLPKREKRIVNYYMMNFLLSSSYVWYYKKIFGKCKPESIVLANDHSYDRRALIYRCEEFNITTIYIQHASVSYAFPELHFTYSFLDGKDALEKYTSHGKELYGKVISLGAVRYDNLSSLQKMRLNWSNSNCIGIAINELDSNEEANNFCNYLLQVFPDIKIIIRSHPAMKKRPFVFDNKDRIIYTCATDETIIDYLKSVDIQISGDSGIHLDAIIAGTPTLAYDFTGEGYGDNYGYVKIGLLSLYNTEEELTNAISLYFNNSSNFHPNEEIVRCFDESYGKSYAGMSHKVVSNFILCGYNLDWLKKEYRLEERIINNTSYLVIPE